MNCPRCELLYEEKPQLIEFEDTDEMTYFRCPKCKVMFEMVEKEDE